ncbi:GNAT family N-acetyltransferase [Fulvivirgaceae bacterium BMA10]|uniref:GNAT family N-acetyltransferase n=1 Tax=Splendidivirga corallicola TaxID=3051826 RepID=A0ABT8KPC2_9BACT|nr:GNAT family N-acetyltransferase [Fulvivirgaceae bacterium BMA10]
MNVANWEIKKLESSVPIPYDLLDLADPSRAMIDSYLNEGTCYIGILNKEIIGVYVIKEISSGILEIMNIAVKENFQGKGYGKKLIDHVIDLAREKGFKQLHIGTGNSSIDQLAFYQKCGFEIHAIEKNFFLDNYIEPIFENGIQCKHLVKLCLKF